MCFIIYSVCLLSELLFTMTDTKQSEKPLALNPSEDAEFQKKVQQVKKRQKVVRPSSEVYEAREADMNRVYFSACRMCSVVLSQPVSERAKDKHMGYFKGLFFFGSNTFCLYNIVYIFTYYFTVICVRVEDG